MWRQLAEREEVKGPMRVEDRVAKKIESRRTHSVTGVDASLLLI
jgi:hypothetical protein